MRAKEFINEWFEPEFKNTKKTVAHDRMSLAKKAEKHKSGSYGYVTDTPNDPGTVTKTQFDSDAGSTMSAYGKMDKPIDLYYVWVKMCSADSNMAKNPYLPRVYVVDDREDINGQRMPRYKMEKLYSLSDESINSEMLITIARKIAISEDIIEDYTNNAIQYAEDEGYDPGSIIKSQMIKLIIKHVHGIYYGDVSQYGNISRAINMVYKIKKGFVEANLDMRKSNFMIRLTSVGPQLVFTDPIAGEVPFSRVQEFLKSEGIQ